MARQQVSIPRVINKWTAIKLEHLDAYLQGYVKATKSYGECYYIDAFAGCGDCILEENGWPIPGSPWRALAAVPPFRECFFVEIDVDSANHLTRKLEEVGIRNAHVLTGDCNEVIPSRVLPQISKRAPSFAFLDPTGLQLHWDTLAALAKHRSDSRYKMELLILYPYDMSINRNLRNTRGQSALDRFYGTDEWRSELLESDLIKGEDAAGRRERFVAFFVRRLKSLGYTHVELCGPLYESHTPKYHMVFAGDNDTGAKIMREVWSKPRPIPGELNYRPLKRPQR
jgi:three-Cys-motif partner protein